MIQAPLLQIIRDRFDTFGETIGNRNLTSSMKIEPNIHSYTVTTYPEGTYGFEGFTMNVTAPGGIFGEEGPTRVEMSRESDGILRFSTAEATSEGDDGLTMARMTIEPHAARERLILPGDPGFELFDQLHAELRSRRQLIAQVFSMIGITVEPTQLTYISQTTSAGVYDHEKGIATHERGTLIKVLGTDHTSRDRVLVRVDLDGSQTAQLRKDGPPNYPPQDPMVFRAGSAHADWDLSWKTERPEVDDEALLAFAALHASFATLYK